MLSEHGFELPPTELSRERPGSEEDRHVAAFGLLGEEELGSSGLVGAV